MLIDISEIKEPFLKQCVNKEDVSKGLGFTSSLLVRGSRAMKTALGVSPPHGPLLSSCGQNSPCLQQSTFRSWQLLKNPKCIMAVLISFQGKG